MFFNEFGLLYFYNNFVHNIRGTYCRLIIEDQNKVLPYT